MRLQGGIQWPGAKASGRLLAKKTDNMQLTDRQKQKMIARRADIMAAARDGDGGEVRRILSDLFDINVSLQSITNYRRTWDKRVREAKSENEPYYLYAFDLACKLRIATQRLRRDMVGAAI